jgi:hypothetical protein
MDKRKIESVKSKAKNVKNIIAQRERGRERES